MRTDLTVPILIMTALLVGCGSDQKPIDANPSQSWYALGSGLGDETDEVAVFALAVQNGDLVASGCRVIPDHDAWPATVFRWDGTTWNPVGGEFNDVVSVLMVWDGELIAAGRFTEVDGVAVNRIARLAGTAWVPLGEGTDGYISALVVWNGELVAGGAFARAGSATVANVAIWNGHTWHGLGNASRIATLLVWDGSLLAGGTSTGPSGSIAWVARLVGGGWSPLGHVEHGTGNIVWSWVKSSALYGQTPVIGGQFAASGDVVLNCVASWSNAGWLPLAGGVGGNYLSGESVNCLTVIDDRLYAGGQFRTAQGQVVNSIAKWDGASWSALAEGVDGDVRAMTTWRGDLVVGGWFSKAGGSETHSIAAWSE